MIISLLQEKGGSGKTTISTNVATVIKSFGQRVLLVDTDPQGSARDWHELNNGLTLDVVGLDRLTIDNDIHNFIPHYDYIFIDGAPHLKDTALKMAIKIIRFSDAILIPVQPSPYDVLASSSLVSLVKERQAITGGELKAAFIISRRIGNSKLGREVSKVLADYNLPILSGGTYNRISYPETAAKGLTVFNSSDGQARNEIIELATSILEFTSC
jgi:chromosome partitioning protein